MTLAFDERIFRTLPLLIMAAAAAGGIAWGPGWSEQVAAVPWLVSLFVVGLPHGATDWAISRQTWGRQATVRLALAYLACMAGVFAVFVTAPLPVIAVFASVSVWHFGMAHADGQSPPIADSASLRGIAAVARGGLVLGVPLACWPDATAGVVADVCRLVAGDERLVDASVVQAAGLVAIGLAVAAFAIEAAGAWRQPAERRRTVETAVELAVIALLGVTTAPLFSVGLYFFWWHGWRQMRLLAPVVVGAAPSDPRALVESLAAIHRVGLPLLVPTWLVLAAAWWLLSPAHSARDLALLSLAAYLVVTPSHDILIDLMRQRSVSRAAGSHPSTVPPSCAARSRSCWA
jgi:Brp/Blh family beta-carotene 15,15'-monooxygenase